MVKRIDTESGSYLVYHVIEAYAPELHDTTSGVWFFQPSDHHGGEVFSSGHPTQQAAEDAAREWDAAETDEAAAD